MMACISPAYTAYEETVNTLKYASRARKIKKKVTQNVKDVEAHVSEYKDIIESLKMQINGLRE
jgi:kinesin family protein 18/19